MFVLYYLKPTQKLFFKDLSTMETESYLRATERVVSALAARVSLSLDSGGESDADNSLGQTSELHRQVDSGANDSANTMRYNRAFRYSKFFSKFPLTSLLKAVGEWGYPAFITLFCRQPIKISSNIFFVLFSFAKRVLPENS